MIKKNKMIKNKRAQEEMIGFVLIIIMVAIIILVFLTVSLRKSSNSTESYEVESFLQSLSQYTTDCAINYYPNYLDLKDLIKECSNNEICLDLKNTCDVLNQTLEDLLDSSWQIGEDWPNKGYLMNITYLGSEVFSREKGNLTLNSKGSIQNFQNLDILFEVYF